MAEAVGTVRAVFTGTTSGLDTSADTAASKIEAFGNSGTKAAGQFVHFNASMLESRKALSVFASVAGTSVGPLMHLVHGFGMLGIYGGAAVASFLLIRESVNAGTEALKKSTEEVNKFHEVWKQLHEHANLESFGKEFTTLKQQMLELKNFSWGGFWDFMTTGGKGTKEQMQVLQGEFKRLQNLYMKEGGSNMTEEKHKANNTSAHILKAVSGGSLGALRLEHVGHDPNTGILKQIAKNTTPKANPLSTPSLAIAW